MTDKAANPSLALFQPYKKSKPLDAEKYCSYAEGVDFSEVIEAFRTQEDIIAQRQGWVDIEEDIYVVVLHNELLDSPVLGIRIKDGTNHGWLTCGMDVLADDWNIYQNREIFWKED